MLLVLKLINNVGPTAEPTQNDLTQIEVAWLLTESNKILKNYLIKTFYTNKIAPLFKKYFLSKEPRTVHDANDLAEVLCKHKNLESQTLTPKSIFAIEANFENKVQNFTKERENVK